MATILEKKYEIICAVKLFSEYQGATFFCDKIAMLKHCWAKLIDIKMDYIER